MATQTKGFCKYCGKEYTKGGMLRHLATCKKRKVRLDLETGKTKGGYFEVVISAKYNNNYWLIIEISEQATLKELDQFIRDIWVECCGHLSEFKINGIMYDSTPFTDSFWGAVTKSMNYKLKDVVKVGETITYEYDFGSTTELVLKIHNYCTRKRKKEKITILSRNNPLQILCSQCEKNKAKWINMEGFYDEDPFWCEECVQKEFMEEEEFDEYDIPYYFSEIYNSPRMGVCGYEGSHIYPEQFLPDEE